MGDNEAHAIDLTDADKRQLTHSLCHRRLDPIWRYIQEVATKVTAACGIQLGNP